MVVTNLQRHRRTDPYPWTWEPAAGAAAGIGFLMLLAVHAGRALATALTGHGLTWPTPARLVTAIPAILTGDPTAGLPPDTARAITGVVPAGLLYAAIGAAELLVLTGCAAVASWLLTRYGPRRMQGMAAPTQAEQLLGITRLRRNRHIIRPDLYPTPPRRRRDRPRQPHRTDPQ